MSQRIIKYGIVGCGEHAFRSHFQSAERVGGYELVALCDPKLTTAEEFTKRGGDTVRVYQDLETFLTDPDLEAVVICTPDALHASQTLACLSANKHVLVDKPAAHDERSLDTIEEAIGVAVERKLVLSSCHPRRYNPAYVQVRDALPGLVAKYGQLLALSLDFSYHKPSKEGLHTGLLADHLNHEYDFARFLLGPSPTAFTKLVDGQDRYAVAGVRADDVVLHFLGTRRLENRIYPEVVHLRFDRGDVRIDTVGMQLDCDHEHGMTLEMSEAKKTNYETAFDSITRNFAAAVRSEESCYLSVDDLYLNSAACVWLTELGEWTSPE